MSAFNDAISNLVADMRENAEDVEYYDSPQYQDDTPYDRLIKPGSDERREAINGQLMDDIEELIDVFFPKPKQLADLVDVIKEAMLEEVKSG